ncbi:MAG: TetR/AcrR family transcriptional regulator, ethionamide resistance regulator [Mycobacterium sp.]|nr:TetR/AcrR family transcriptional regulator, ethionamide resistance regulator [Mycobacterium sp.]MDT5386633.1 TetR/AcrR family transcriptional regulator, ethionamide resistance regulator [Mycobacterium sp.]MDT7759785.1 TetR/AcrR family transcriptional regulator, ethionamide resistance regulator [Mycobacterium sp.]
MRSQTDRRPPQRSDYRREAILDALDTWLQESSLEAINIAEISKQAGVTRSAFYFYFENKGAAVAALMERMIDETIVVNEHFTSTVDSPRNRIYAMLDGLFAMRARHHHLFKAMLEVRGSSTSVRDIWDGARESFTESIAEMIRADRAAGRAPDGLDPEVLAAVLLEVNDRLLERLTLGGTLTSAQLKDGAAAIWLSSVYGITDLSEQSGEPA